mmetsp:Transcript_7323/g.13069  ORF Transcript_7323/g.13069 Transcript_7323/m.13069 type:complete len:300 (+) Transcript_7323:103-1002(+)|eukprot:CAMPEP_0184691210 /NCGR_PEP_ID=MMETSP0313-20130426/119_1 /TAXON_ID=2792 /ORGANISM="Porphyridium aerugineum, Strain SAG 1380-2" /LENGTH=299 /DNA_ID=CAMNT_0027148887 /DNA_START=69 /DNA_END=968 /DNA_ORIENTATION=+
MELVAFVNASLAPAQQSSLSSSCSTFVVNKPRQVVVVTSCKNSRTIVHMNLFERFSRVVRSTANKALNKLESPEKILEQTVIDMQSDLVKVRQSYAEVSATQKKLERQREQAQKTAAEWLQRAQLALQKGDEELAREALVRKNQADDQLKALTAQIEVMQANVIKLGDSLAEIESKISEAQAQKDELIARARTAQTTTKVNDMLNNVGTSSGLAAFEKMREKVEALEAQSEVSAQMALKGSSPSIESKFRELEATSSVDDELQRMKQQLQLPHAKNTSGAAYSSSVNDEIERLKREQGL